MTSHQGVPADLVVVALERTPGELLPDIHVDAKHLSGRRDHAGSVLLDRGPATCIVARAGDIGRQRRQHPCGRQMVGVPQIDVANRTLEHFVVSHGARFLQNAQPVQEDAHWSAVATAVQFGPVGSNFDAVGVVKPHLVVRPGGELLQHVVQGFKVVHQRVRVRLVHPAVADGKHFQCPRLFVGERVDVENELREHVLTLRQRLLLLPTVEKNSRRGGFHVFFLRLVSEGGLLPEHRDDSQVGGELLGNSVAATGGGV